MELSSIFPPSNFSLEILEYCSTEGHTVGVALCKKRTIFLDVFQPEYNTLKKAGSLLGFKHSEETKPKI